MRQIRSDLWETRPDNPFPGLTTHAYLWTGGQHGNVLFYSTATDADFDAITALGGVAHQYLSHRDEAGPQLGIIKERFGAVLHAPAIEEADIGKYATIDVPLAGRHVDAAGIEVIPTPGHTPGSTCYLVPGANGQSYLFTGDTIFLGEDGDWAAGYLPGYSDAATLRDSLHVLGHEHPDLVISSAFPAESAVQVPGSRWAACVEQARAGVKLPA
ncbi:MBL fold metallo-hydrolase [Mycolicibacterium bacteremicum]|uniref:MBL fold metallo-hydrolase n=1 Tax=Mycolicibacterium bacteremicum TaxID=564198 RepID=A0A1W9YRC6_MYCBA|nr:MBL fold metallo-hydrolase [Mycolicibacterium bacteremicum]MCV7430127.1 MBL fold metallo-hydrolase [Mycolicibacterium bacteremicum]ORA02539.1 MBL fold metallo-hydrolase [Mycolicibacterium bacteremicum]